MNHLQIFKCKNKRYIAHVPIVSTQSIISMIRTLLIDQQPGTHCQIISNPAYHSLHSFLLTTTYVLPHCSTASWCVNQLYDYKSEATNRTHPCNIDALFKHIDIIDALTKQIRHSDRYIRLAAGAQFVTPNRNEAALMKVITTNAKHHKYMHVIHTCDATVFIPYPCNVTMQIYT